MKCVKCYGKAKFVAVDSSFKRKFFESFDSKTSVGNSSFQELQQKGSSSFTSISSASDYTNQNSRQLFASDNSSFDGSLPTSPCSSRKVKRKHKYVKHSALSKTGVVKKYYHTSAAKSSASKAKKLFNKQARTSKSSVRQKISKQFKLPVELTALHSSQSDLALSFAQGRSKSTRHLQLYKKGILKRKPKLSHHSSFKKHSSIPIQPSCSEFCENPLSVIKTGVKKINKKVGGKKKQLNNKVQDVVTSRCFDTDIITSFNSKHDSFWAAIQPRWSSICEHSFQIEKTSKEKTIPMFFEQHANKDASFSNFNSKDNELLSSKESISSGTLLQFEGSNKCAHPLAVEGPCGIHHGKRDNFPKQSIDLNVVPSKHADSNFSADFMSATQTNFLANKTISEKRKKKSACLSKNVDQLRDYASSVSFKKHNDFYSSTPLASPSTHDSVVKLCPFGVFSPVFEKGPFVTSTPLFQSRENQMYNMSRISYLMRQHNSLKNLSFDSYDKQPRCSKSSSSVQSRRNKKPSTYQPFISRSLHRTQNIHNSTSKYGISVSIRENLSMGESHCWSKRSSLPNVALDSVTSTSAERDLDTQSTLSNLLEFCSQTRIIPFKELYDWSHTTLRKIGEGTYGEVFTIVQNKISSVVKVIPFSEENADHNMQSIESVLSEVTVSKCLSELRNNKTNKTRNFSKLKSVHLVRGCYPDQMLFAWDKFSVAKSTYNSRPDIFNDQQMFAIIELEYGGKDMTCFMLRNAAEAESVLKQIAISLAIAEEVHLFEHRDLHLGNILVQRNASKTISYVFGGEAFSIPNQGLVVTIIDFTLSRVLHKGCIFYNNLADDVSLFNQTGDFQFQIYKDTRLHLNNEWHKCLLYSNVLWLTYLCVKLLEYKYSRPSSKKHQEGLNNISTFQKNLRNCQTAFECVTSCNILTSVPKKEQGSTKKMAMKAKLVDRKSSKSSTSYL